MEVATTEAFNPIKQDTKKDKTTGQLKLREYGIKPCFNYGMMPQTWECNTHKDNETSCFGDNDPLDVVEMGSSILERAAVVQVKVLGSLCLIDQGELDWKLLTINLDEANSKGVSHL